MADDDRSTWIRGYLERVVNQRDLTGVDELVSPEFRGSGSGWAPDRDSLRAFYARQGQSRPDWHISVEDTVELGEWVAVRARAGGTVHHDQAGQPLDRPHRQRLEWLAVFRIENGRLTETTLVTVMGDT